MKKSDISKALGSRIATANLGYPLAWENKNFGDKKPFLVFELVPVSSQDNTLAGGFEIHTGFMQVSVVAELNKFSNEADDIADEVASLFPKALKMPITGGTITIMAPAFVGQGYRDVSDWRVPVRVDYEAS